MRIFIPSRGRGPHRQLTYEVLRHTGFPITTVCHSEDKILWPEWEAEPFPHEHYSQVRQHCIDLSITPIFIVDDDFKSWSWYRGGSLWTKATTDEIIQGFDEVYGLLQTHAMVGIGQRFMVNQRPLLHECTRVNGCIGINPTLLRRAGATFRLPVMGDFDLNLQLLTKGYKTLTYNKLVFEQAGSNTEGGCSIYRTNEVQSRGAEALAALWPEFVSIRKKETKHSWGGQPRLDVSCRWKAAFLSSATGSKNGSPLEDEKKMDTPNPGP